VSAVGRRNCSDPEAIAPFGSLESLYRLDTTTGPSRFDHSTNLACSVFARMEYTAGVVTCLNCRLSAGGIIKTTLEAESIEPDPLAEQASRMMPNVLALMSTSHSWQTWACFRSLIKPVGTPWQIIGLMTRQCDRLRQVGRSQL
jgi:hypothetical protein